MKNTKMAWKGFKDVQATIEIDLNRSPDELWDSLDKDARWGVKKAEKEGLTITNAANDLDWESFYEIYKETIIHGGIVPQELNSLKEKTSKLFLCHKDKETIAGAAITILDKRIKLFLNASKKDYQKYQPNNLLYWHIIKYGAENNFEIFDLGGYQLNAQPEDKLYSINRFKERWGGKIVTYQVYNKNPVYIFGRKIIRNFPKIKSLRDKSKLKLWKIKNEKTISKA
ncbi:MAG: peptidoglycan bridge formation glycyltransferase FemA/FemB family protein [Candidatus Pacearchaeota archaeon]|jgi:lipid II:glycine glycyltransferase (peptidoglycan interpeptide bridge formation enzyme)